MDQAIGHGSTDLYSLGPPHICSLLEYFHIYRTLGILGGGTPVPRRHLREAMLNYSIQEMRNGMIASSLRANPWRPISGKPGLFWRVNLGDLGDINTVAQTIQQIEGYYPGSLSYRNNNPGNLRPAGQPGCTPVGGFCSFPDYATGYQAELNQISLDASRGETISQFTAKYAPAQDNNDPASYAARIANAEGLSVNDPLSSAISSGSLPALSSPDSTDTTDTSASMFGGTISIFGYDVPVSYLALGAAGLIGLYIATR
jgi:hypothetical protein